MGRTRMGRTDGMTDGRTRRRLYAPPKFFGEHKNAIHQMNTVHDKTMHITRQPSYDENN